jgi:hypothetical protein
VRFRWETTYRKEDPMKRNQLLSAVGIVLLLAGSLAAQDRGTPASIEFQKVKAANVPQYEAGQAEGGMAQAAERSAAFAGMGDAERRKYGNVPGRPL